MMLKPQAGPTRELVNLDGLWRFGIAGRVQDEPRTDVLQSDLEAAVPASYNDLFVDPAIREHVHWSWYQRTVHVPRGWAGERIFVRLNAATHAGRVFVDDVLVAEHVGGYRPLEADITESVRAGTSFRLTVGVDNELTNIRIPPGSIRRRMDGRRRRKCFHDFYNYAGLSRSVWPYSVPTERIVDVTVVTDREGADGSVHYMVQTTGHVEVRAALSDADGAVVATSEGALSTLSIAEVTLWEPGAAYLYDLRIEAVRDGVLVDTYLLPVGVRTVAVPGSELLINGEPFYFTGWGTYDDSAVRGKVHDHAYLVHDFQLLECIGANSFRRSHYPHAEEVLEFADRQGIVVIDETATVGFDIGVEGGLTGAPRPRHSRPTPRTSSRKRRSRSAWRTDRATRTTRVS